MCVRGDGAFLCLAINRGTASPQSPQEKPFSSSSRSIITRSCTSVPLRRLKHFTICQEMQTISCLPFVRTGSRLPLLRLQPWLLAFFSPPLALTHTRLIHSHAGPQPLTAARLHTPLLAVAQSARVRAPPLRRGPRRTGTELPGWFANIQSNRCLKAIKWKVNNWTPKTCTKNKLPWVLEQLNDQHLKDYGKPNFSANEHSVLIETTKHFCKLLWIRTSAKCCRCKSTLLFNVILWYL